jgi:nickel/cobalt exporter
MQYLIMLASAFGLGAAHALEPGHGKTVVAAYLVSSRGRTLDAIILGGVVTFTHTFSVILLAIASTVAAAYLVPSQVERWLGLGCGLLVVAVGAWMIYARIKHGPPAHSRAPGEHSHDRASDEHRDHPHPRDYEHDHDHPGLEASGGDAAGPAVGLGSLVALGISGGIVPCPAALALLLAAVGLRQITRGVMLLVSFSLGLALVLMAIGIVTLKVSGFA